MNDSIDQYMKRPGRYVNIDGTSEMGFGVAILGVALSGYLPAMLPKDSVWQQGFRGLLLFEIIVVAFGCLGYFGSKAVKKYITYPRTGYVAYLRPKGFGWTRVALLSLGCGAFACILFLIAQTWRHNATISVRLGMAGVTAVSYCALGSIFARAQQWKWGVYGLLSLGLAAIYLATGWEFTTANGLAVLLTALTYTTSGAATFWLYMRRTQPARPEGE